MTPDHQPLEELNPEDFGLILGLAGPIYAESKLLDSMTGVKPTTGGGYHDDGAMKIKRGLEDIQRSLQAPKPQQHVYQPPPKQYFAPPEYVQPVMPEITQTYISPVNGVNYNVTSNGASPSDQLEFDFNITEQRKTNELLEKNNKLLTKIISLLESKKSNEPIKLDPKIKGIPTFSKQSI
jgi:hypothetical protein